MVSHFTAWNTNPWLALCEPTLASLSHQPLPEMCTLLPEPWYLLSSQTRDAASPSPYVIGFIILVPHSKVLSRGGLHTLSNMSLSIDTSIMFCSVASTDFFHNPYHFLKWFCFIDSSSLEYKLRENSRNAVYPLLYAPTLILQQCSSCIRVYKTYWGMNFTPLILWHF